MPIGQIDLLTITHIDSKNGNYVRLLFIDYSSAFNIIVIGAPQGCVLSPLLYSLYTYDCVSSHSSISISISFLNCYICWWYCGSGPHFQQWWDCILGWVRETCIIANCLSLNVSKTKELIVDFRKRQQRPYTPLMISGTPVERVSSFKYLGVNISKDLTWTAHIQSQVKKARQRLYHLRQLRKFRVSPAILKTFYSGAIESVLTQCISVWYGNASNQDCKALQRVVRLAERISASALPSLQDICLKRCKSRASKIIKDSNHSGNQSFHYFRRCTVQSTLRWLRSICAFIDFFTVFLLSLFTRITSALFIYDKITLLDIGQRCTNLLQYTSSTDPAWPLEIQTRFPKSWDTVQIVNKNRMQWCGSFKFQYFIQNTT